MKLSGYYQMNVNTFYQRTNTRITRHPINKPAEFSFLTETNNSVLLHNLANILSLSFPTRNTVESYAENY